MTVCHIISGDLWAGAEKLAFSLMKVLVARFDVRVVAIVLNEGRLSQSIREQGIPTLVLSEDKLSLFHIYSEIRKIIKRIRPEIVHSHRYKENLLAYLATRSTKSDLKLVATQHGIPEHHCGAFELVTRYKILLNDQILSKKFNTVVAVSRDIMEAFTTQRGFKAEKIKVIRNGIEVPPEPKKRSDDPQFVVGSAGRLSPVKDYRFLVEVAREVSRLRSGISFVLAGDGPERSKVEGLVNLYGLQKSFCLKGFMADLSSFYGRLNLYMNTSVHEGIPLSVLEAMAHGLPIIAPKVGGLEEIVDEGSEGFLVASRDPALFAEKCVVLYDNKNLRDRMSLAARRRLCDAFSVDRMASDYFSLYEELLET